MPDQQSTRYAYNSDGEFVTAHVGTQEQFNATGFEEGPEPNPKITGVMINAERDRRIAAGFVFNGTLFDFDPHSKQRVTGAATLAGFAAAAGSLVGDLRWANDDNDFVWIAADNSLVSMDAQTCFAFGKAAADHESRHIFAANALKSMNLPPEDFTNDIYWP